MKLAKHNLSIHRDECDGFTLIELLFAVVITALVAVTVVTSFKTVVSSYEKNGSGVIMVENARAALGDMTINFRSTPAATTPFIQSFATNSTPIVTTLLDTAALVLQARGYSRDSIHFIGAANVDYWYFIDTSTNQLMRNTGGTVEPLAFGVLDLNFLFFNRDTSSGQWYTVWNSGYPAGSPGTQGMPRSIYIALTVKDESKRLIPHTYTTLVTLP